MSNLQRVCFINNTNTTFTAFDECLARLRALGLGDYTGPPRATLAEYLAISITLKSLLQI